MIQEIEGGLEGWRTGGRYQEMGILEHVRPRMHTLSHHEHPAVVILMLTMLALAKGQRAYSATMRGHSYLIAWLQVANKDYRWAY